jgi:hypothetical protein
MKWSCFLSQAVLSMVLMLGFEQVAHSQFLDSELYELCKQYPYNSRCKDIKELPLSLDDRSDFEQKILNPHCTNFLRIAFDPGTGI